MTAAKDFETYTTARLIFDGFTAQSGIVNWMKWNLKSVSGLVLQELARIGLDENSGTAWDGEIFAQLWTRLFELICNSSHALTPEFFVLSCDFLGRAPEELFHLLAREWQTIADRFAQLHLQTKESELLCKYVLLLLRHYFRILVLKIVRKESVQRLDYKHLVQVLAFVRSHRSSAFEGTLSHFVGTFPSLRSFSVVLLQLLLIIKSTNQTTDDENYFATITSWLKDVCPDEKQLTDCLLEQDDDLLESFVCVLLLSLKWNFNLYDCHTVWLLVMTKTGWNAEVIVEWLLSEEFGASWLLLLMKLFLRFWENLQSVPPLEVYLETAPDVVVCPRGANVVSLTVEEDVYGCGRAIQLEFCASSFPKASGRPSQDRQLTRVHFAQSVVLFRDLLQRLQRLSDAGLFPYNITSIIRLLKLIETKE